MIAASRAQTWLRGAKLLAPMLLAGWFLFVVIVSFQPWLGRPIALPQAQASSPFMDDFVVFHTAGRTAAEIGGSVYEPSTISKHQAEATGQDSGSVLVLPFFNPPSALLPLSLLGLLPLQTAAVIWVVIGPLLALICLLRLAREVALSVTGALPLLLLGAGSSFPFHEALVHGQMTFLLLAGRDGRTFDCIVLEMKQKFK